MIERIEALRRPIAENDDEDSYEQGFDEGHDSALDAVLAVVREALDAAPTLPIADLHYLAIHSRQGVNPVVGTMALPAGNWRLLKEGS